MEILLFVRAISSFLKKQESIKEYLKAKDIYIVFDSDNQTKETKVQEIKEQLQENPKEEHRLNDEEFNQIKIFYCQKMMRLNTISNYCGLEHSLEKMAKESENKAFHASFCQHYNALFNKVFEKINKNKTSVRREKNTLNVGYNPISRFLFV